MFETLPLPVTAMMLLWPHREYPDFSYTTQISRVDDVAQLFSRHLQRKDLQDVFVAATPAAPKTQGGECFVSHTTHSNGYKQMYTELEADFGDKGDGIPLMLALFHLGSDATQTVMLGGQQVRSWVACLTPRRNLA